MNIKPKKTYTEIFSSDFSDDESEHYSAESEQSSDFIDLEKTSKVITRDFWLKKVRSNKTQNKAAADRSKRPAAGKKPLPTTVKSEKDGAVKKVDVKRAAVLAAKAESKKAQRPFDVSDLAGELVAARSEALKDGADVLLSLAALRLWESNGFSAAEDMVFDEFVRASTNEIIILTNSLSVDTEKRIEQFLKQKEAVFKDGEQNEEKDKTIGEANIPALKKAPIERFFSEKFLCASILGFLTFLSDKILSLLEFGQTLENKDKVQNQLYCLLIALKNAKKLFSSGKKSENFECALLSICKTLLETTFKSYRSELDVIDNGAYTDFVFKAGDEDSEQVDLAFDATEFEKNDFTALAVFVIVNPRSADWFFYGKAPTLKSEKIRASLQLSTHLALHNAPHKASSLLRPIAQYDLSSSPDLAALFNVSAALIGLSFFRLGDLPRAQKPLALFCQTTTKTQKNCEKINIFDSKKLKFAGLNPATFKLSFNAAIMFSSLFDETIAAAFFDKHGHNGGGFAEREETSYLGHLLSRTKKLFSAIHTNFVKDAVVLCYKALKRADWEKSVECMQKVFTFSPRKNAENGEIDFDEELSEKSGEFSENGENGGNKALKITKQCWDALVLKTKKTAMAVYVIKYGGRNLRMAKVPAEFLADRFALAEECVLSVFEERGLGKFLEKECVSKE